ncbi:nucleotidyl transferase AbiEii/AbiGii toxin family protein [Streptomyces sp. NPDC001262]|uniref:nucleotidyl transferase AbiEii/AbiGii toxin family protein n=1 Tax=Streptomyces TaxID=1883 RepID=UPI0036C91774
MTAATPWERFSHGPWDAGMVVPQTPPDEATRVARGLPQTLRPVPGEGVTQRPAHDPAAGHHVRGMRLSEPQFVDAGTGAAWYAARRHALDHVLAAVAGSEWAEHLVLRGSVLLKAWFGDAAREPGDLDFVVVPHTWQLQDARTDALFTDVARAAEALSQEPGSPVRIDASGAASDEIWTYDRVPGRRLVLPWTATADGVPQGTVQLDFVFNEPLPEPPVRTELPRAAPGGTPAVLKAASPALSLAWKILWLVSDSDPEAKDLYDAVLLAEGARTHLTYELLDRVLRESGEPADLGYILYSAAEADWFEFHKDHPELPDSDSGYLARLVMALAPVFAPDEDGLYARLAAAFHDTTELVREERAAGGMEAVEAWFAARCVHSLGAVVVVRELLGRTECTLRGAADVLMTFRDKCFGRDEPLYKEGGWAGSPHGMAARLEAAGAAGAAVSR